MQRFDEDERRRRLGVRHRLAHGTRDADVAAAAASVVALHGTDPGSTFLAAWARTDGIGATDVERALYDDRTLVRVMAMRRTVFVAPTADVPVLVAGAGDDVAREERRKLVKLLADSGIGDAVAWVVDVEQVAHQVVEDLGEITPADLVAADDRLATQVVLGEGTRNETTVRIASRLLTVLAAEGSIVRGRPQGSWTSMQFRWSALDRWAPSAAVAMDPLEAEARLARLWLARFGPATEADLTWWTKWTKTRTRRALARAGGVTALVVAGGVAANTGVRTALEGLATAHGLRFVAPPAWLCTDNAAMIAWAGVERFTLGLTDPLDTLARPRWPLDPNAEAVRGAGVKA